MKHPTAIVAFCLGAILLLLGTLVGIQRGTVSPVHGETYRFTHFVLPGQKPLHPAIPGGGASVSTVRYAYGLLPGGFIDPNRIKLEIRENPIGR